ncbi:MAG: O-antigen ligase family protein [Nitrospinae bacterium]|nr:O-antigen ligase family protein [Nitrospinota bacterium]
MRTTTADIALKLLIPTALLIVVAFLLSTGLLQIPQYYILAGVSLTAILAISFLSPEIGLYILILSMLLSPEILVGEVGGRGTLSRGITLRLDDILIAVIALSYFARTTLDKDLGLFRRTPLNKPIILYGSIIIFSTIWGFMNGRVEAKSGFFFTLKLIEYFFIYFMAVNIIRDRNQVRNLIMVLIVTCILVSVYGIAQIPAGGRVTAPFEGAHPEPNTFGGYLVFMLSLILSISLTHDDRWVRRGMLVFTIITIPILFSLSRSSMVALAAMYLALLAFSPRRTGLILGLIVLVLLGPTVIPEKVQERVTYTWDQPYSRHPLQVEMFGILLDTSTSQRVTSYVRAGRDWLKHPVFGTGVTGYRFLDAQFPRVLVETGMIGFGAFLWLLVSIFRVGYRTFREAKSPLFRGIGLGLTVGIFTLAAHGLGTNTFIIIRIMEPFWLTTGIVVRLLEIEAEEEERAALMPSPSVPDLA